MVESNTTTSCVANEFTNFISPVIIICILGAVSNVLLLVAFVKDPLKCFRNSGTYLVMNITVSDCLICLLSSFANISSRIYSNTAFTFLASWITSVSFVSITSISVDRFLMVASPIKHRILMKGKVKIFWISAIWLVNFVIIALTTVLDASGTNSLNTLCIFCVVVITLSAVTYASTYYKLKKQSRNMALHNSTEGRAQEIRILKEKRFLKTIILITCIAAVCTLPFLIRYLLCSYVGFMAGNLQAKTISFTVCVCIYQLNFAVNPLIYMIRLPNYRRTFYLLYWKKGQLPVRIRLCHLFYLTNLKASSRQ